MTDKSFIKHLEKKILNEVSMFGFEYNEKEKFFYSFYNEIVFKLQLIADKYLFKMYFDYGVPIMEKNYVLFPESFLGYVNREINVNRWNYSNIKKDTIEFEIMIDEILFVIKHYCYSIASSVANEHNMEFYLFEKYYIDYKEFQRTISPFTNDEQFMMTEYLPKGKKYNEWSIKDDEALYLYDKEKKEREYPFVSYKKQLETIAKQNLDRYKLDLSQYSNAKFKTNKDIKRVNIRDFLKTKEGYQLYTLLIDKNYKFYDDNGCYSSINKALFTNKKGSEIYIHIKEYIFIEFEIINKEKNIIEYLYQYDFSPFTIGWIIGDEIKIKESVNLALDTLSKII